MILQEGRLVKYVSLTPKNLQTDYLAQFARMQAAKTALLITKLAAAATMDTIWTQTPIPVLDAFLLDV